jgi:xylan 1,4-beta-xylosidase
MMKHSLDLAEEVGVDLKGVLTWAFTFPGAPYFPGYRALSTNGIHLPVLGAFKFLGKLSGERLPVQSSGALALSALMEASVRETAEVDALASVDAGQIRVLVWNYHDDLVAAAPIQVSLNLNLPEDFHDGVAVAHERIDHSHGNAFTVWESQGSPAEPSAVELAELREAMNDFLYEPEQVLRPQEGSVSLSFGLPRFGLSLLTISPATKAQMDRLSEEPPSLDPAGCYCRAAPARGPSPAPLSLVFLLVALATARRKSHSLLKPTSGRMKVPGSSTLLN